MRLFKLIVFIFVSNFIFGDVFKLEVFLIFFLNLIVLCCIASFFVKNPIYSLLFLIINYVTVGVIFMFNNFAFLSLIFMLMYVGAISILLLFTLMLLNLKFIYYTGSSGHVFNIFLYLLAFIQVISFYFMLKSYSVVYKENSYFFDWFLIFIFKNDLSVISAELYLKNSVLVFIVSFLVLMSLLASVNIVNSLKTCKKQDSYYQLKNYNRNFLN